MKQWNTPVIEELNIQETAHYEKSHFRDLHKERHQEQRRGWNTSIPNNQGITNPGLCTQITNNIWTDTDFSS